jgi:hypothetical protein
VIGSGVWAPSNAGILFSHAISGELKAVNVVNEAVKARIAEGGVADAGAPLVDWELPGYEGGTAAISVSQDLQEVVAGAGIERGEAPVVEDQHVGAASRRGLSMRTRTSSRRMDAVSGASSPSAKPIRRWGRTAITTDARLTGHYRALSGRGKKTIVVCAAIAHQRARDPSFSHAHETCCEGMQTWAVGISWRS